MFKNVSGLFLLVALVLACQDPASPKPSTITIKETITKGFSSPSIARLPYSAMNISRQKAFLFVSGEANTERGATIPAKDKSFFTNVKTLRYDNINSNVNNENAWAWDNFSSLFTYNLGKKTEGHLHTQTYGIALGWQEAINKGTKLPDLYIIQVSHASFGFSMESGPGYRPEFGGFNPDYDETPGATYSDVPIERFWKFIPRVHRWAINNLIGDGSVVRHLGLFWNQYEHDVAEGDPTNYKTFLNEFLNLFDRQAGFQIPLFHLYPRAPFFKTNSKNEPIIQRVFNEIKNEREYVVPIDLAQNTSYDSTDSKNGVFVDNFHYKNEVIRDFIAKVALDYFLGTTSTIGKNGSIRKDTDFRDYGGLVTEAVPPPALTLFEKVAGKLNGRNRIGLGSTTVIGNVINTGTRERDILNVINTYLNDDLTTQELDFILNNKNKYKWEIGCGDRRAQSNLLRRFSRATNWGGEDATDKVLSPDPYPLATYTCTLTFNSTSKKLRITDSHVSTNPNAYGAIRYITVSLK